MRVLPSHPTGTGTDAMPSFSLLKKGKKDVPATWDVPGTRSGTWKGKGFHHISEIVSRVSRPMSRQPPGHSRARRAGPKMSCPNPDARDAALPPGWQEQDSVESVSIRESPGRGGVQKSVTVSVTDSAGARVHAVEAQRGSRVMPDIRSPEAAQWRRLYKLSRWQRIRRHVLASEPLCQRCMSLGRVTAATVVHHNPPHEGDIERFWSGPFEALCAPCHDGPVGQAERSGRAAYDSDVGADGFPTDPRHPFNRAG